MTRQAFHFVAIPALIAALSAGTDPAVAQRPRIRLGSTGFQAGSVGIEVNALNQVLGPLGYPSLTGRFATTGAGGQLAIGRLSVSVIGQALVRKTVESANLQLAASGNYTVVELGWALVSIPGTVFTPFAGAGRGTLDLRLSSGAGTAFGDVVSTPRSSEISSSSWFLHAGAAVEQTVLRFGANNVTVGMRGGYLFRAGQSSWRADDGTVSDAPNAGFQGPYARFGVSISHGRVTP